MWVTIFRLGSTMQKHPNLYCLPAEFPQIPLLWYIKFRECMPSANSDRPIFSQKPSYQAYWLDCVQQLKEEKLRIQKHQWHRIVKLLRIVTQLIPAWNITAACGPIRPTFTQLFTVNLPQLMQIWQKMAGIIIKKMKMAHSIALLWCSEIVP